MWINNIDNTQKQISISIPLTKGTEKTRIKKRSYFNEYGIPVPTRSEVFSLSCYVEWQIGYDVIISDEEKLKRTTTKDSIFIGANGKKKTLYELSEYIYYFHKWGIVTPKELLSIRDFLTNIKDSEFIDSRPDLCIERSHPIEKNILGTNYYYSQTKYPLLIYKYGDYEILNEIIIKEKQYAIGVQPMLYLCFPITELKSENQLLGRCAESKETADFLINSKNIYIFTTLLKMFGTLSKSHNEDVLSIIEVIIGSQS